MALKPLLPPYPLERKKSVPASVDIPASPTRAPEIVSTSTVARRASIPAVRPADGLEPITLNWKPSVLLRMNHDIPAATARAMISPKLTRRPAPNRWGSWALVGMVREMALLWPGCCSGGVVSR